MCIQQDTYSIGANYDFLPIFGKEGSVTSILFKYQDNPVNVLPRCQFTDHFMLLFEHLNENLI